jgi:hypothetical protein
MAQCLKGFLFLNFFCCFLAQAQEELPFWHSKPKLLEQMREERKIIVSVKDFPSAIKEKRIIGAGYVKAPFDKVAIEVFNFENLGEVSEYFKKVIHKKEEQRVYIFIQALGFQSRLLLKYKINKINDQFVQMDWIVIWGRLKGMQGNFQIKKIDPIITEISLWSTVKEINIPVPDLLINFTLEVITEKVAQKMRTYLESKCN